MTELLDLEVGAPAHGGSCVARWAGRVVFVRHALPGERVRARVTEDRGGSFLRADAVEILEPAPGRVTPPCRYAGPGRCGGCDWQHADPAVQRELKATVVRDQFRRLARMDVAGLLAHVEELPGGPLGWRTRVGYGVDPVGRPGLHRHRSHELEPVDRCLIGAPGVGDTDALRRDWPGLIGIEAVGGDDAVAVVAHRPGRGRRQRGRRPPDAVEVIQGPEHVRHRVGERDFTVAATGFWQPHRAAAATFIAALLSELAPRPAERVLDLYAGAGVFTAAFATAVGARGEVLGVESAAQAVTDAEHDLADLPWARMRRARVDGPMLAALDMHPDLVVLDPPRSGAGREVVGALLAMRPRIVGYLACDPAALARDVATAAGLGWRLRTLRAFDAFPMTHHVECLAVLVPGTPPYDSRS